MPSPRHLLRLIGSTAALFLVALSNTPTTVQAHASLDVNGKEIAKFDGCGFCPIGDYNVPSTLPKNLEPKELFAFLKKNKKSVRQLFGEIIVMPSRGEVDRVTDKTPQSCGRSDLKHVVNAFAATDKIAPGVTPHSGPAEIYVNDKLVSLVEDAQKAPPLSPSIFDCDQPVCEVRWVWLNIDFMNFPHDNIPAHFQLYVNCFSVKGNGKPIRTVEGFGGASSDEAGNDATTPPASPKPTSDAGAATTTKAPKPATTPRASTDAKPLPSGKCGVRRRL